MTDLHQFEYSSTSNSSGDAATRPILPFTLIYRNGSQEVSGLLDTGADVNVLPFNLGIELGAVWEEQETAVRLSGNLANYEARGILLNAVVGQFQPVRLVFAWTQAEQVPLILGQTNFFMVFDVCFFRSRGLFEVSLAARS